MSRPMHPEIRRIRQETQAILGVVPLPRDPKVSLLQLIDGLRADVEALDFTGDAPMDNREILSMTCGLFALADSARRLRAAQSCEHVDQALDIVRGDR